MLIKACYTVKMPISTAVTRLKSKPKVTLLSYAKYSKKL